MGYVVLSTEHFDSKADKYSIPESRIDQISKELQENPYVGKSLGSRLLREKRFEGKRIYYWVFDDLKAVLLVSISNKKTQQATINIIKGGFQEFKILTKNILDEL